jgi:hypothetical protein
MRAGGGRRRGLWSVEGRVEGRACGERGSGERDGEVERGDQKLRVRGGRGGA